MLRVSCDNRPVKTGVFLGFGLGAALGVGRFAYALVLPAMQAALQLSFAQAGLIGSANTAGYFAGALISHRVLTTLGYRRGFYLSLALQALTLAALALGLGFGPVLALRFVQGVLGAFVFVGGAALLLSSGGSSTAMGFYFGGMGLGIAASTVILPFLNAAQNGWQLGWGLLAALSLLLTAVALLALPALREPSLRAPGTDSSGGLRRIAPILVSYGLYGAGYIGYMTFVTSNVSQGLATLWIVLGVGACLTGIIWGRPIDTLGGAVALRLVLLVLLVASLQPLLAAAPLVSALLFGVTFPGVITAITDLFRKGLPPHEWGRAMGLSTATFALGQAVGPGLSGFFGDLAGAATGALWAATALLVLSLAAAFVPLRAAR